MTLVRHSAAAAAVACVFLGGCDINVRDAGPPEHMSKSIDLDKAEMARVEVKIGVGELRMSGGSAKLMEGEFDYAPISWKPNIRYNATGFRGDLKIEQPSSSGGGRHTT